MELRPGYKRTEVGVIPEDWEQATVRGVASSARNAIVGGPFGSNLVSRDYVDQGVPVIRGQNMGQRRLEGPFVFVSERKASSLGANLARPGDIVFTQRGTLGQVSIVPDAPFQSYLVSQSQMKVSLNAEIASPRFVYYVFSSESGQELIRNSAIQTGVPHINLGILRNLRFQLPRLEEQQAISSSLEEMDTLLDALTRLLTKKRDLKQAAMQQLLTGQTRLPGFSEQWKVMRLDRIAKINPESLGSDIHRNLRIRYISLEDVEAGVLRGFSELAYGDAPSRARRKLKRGDVLVGTVRPNLRSHLLFNAFGEDWICSTGFAVVRCRDEASHPGYVFAHLFGAIVSRQIEAVLTGSNYPAINSADVRALELPMPAYDEQFAIATILTDMDTEIAALEERLAKTRALKQGMMQELLTGRIRLI